MTTLKPEQLKKLKDILEEIHGTEISDEEVLEIGIKLVLLGEICLETYQKKLG